MIGRFFCVSLALLCAISRTDACTDGFVESGNDCLHAVLMNVNWAEARDGQWVWMDSQKTFTYTNWAPGQPKNGGVVKTAPTSTRSSVKGRKFMSWRVKSH